jgi:hypothetical protein
MPAKPDPLKPDPKPDKPAAPPPPTCATCPCFQQLRDHSEGLCRLGPAVLVTPSGLNCASEWSQPLMHATDVCWQHPALKRKAD